MKYYDPEKLMQVVRHRGYVTYRAVGDALAPIFGIKSGTIQLKLKNGRLTKEECEVIGSYFEMTMKEYYDTFMSGLFVEDEEGHYVCRVKDPYMHLHPNHKGRTSFRPKTRKERTLDLLEKIENIDSE